MMRFNIIRCATLLVTTLIIGSGSGIAKLNWVVQSASAQDALSIDSKSNVGIGTSTPVAPLHIHRDDASAQVLVEETDSTVAPRSLLELLNTGPIGFNMENTATGDRWRFAAQTTGFRISLAGTGGPEFEVLANGDAVLAGTLTENSDVHVKRDIEALDGHYVLARLDELPVAEWSYKADAPGIRHIGPMAQDFHAAFGLGHDETTISPRDMAGVNMAAIKAQQKALQALTAENESQQERIAELEENQAAKDAEIVALQARLGELEQLKAQLAAIQSQLPQQVALTE